MKLHFIAVELNPQGSQQDQCLYFRTNMDDVVLASAENPLTIHFSPHNRFAFFLTWRSGMD